MKKRSITIIIYLAGFGICLGSYALLVHYKGHRGSNLAWAVVALSEFVRHSLALSWERPGNVLNVSTMFASAVIALSFVGVLLLMKAHSKYLRVIGFGALAFLLYLILYWFSTPLNVF